MIKGTVTIIGRPDVGKSTLFNRLTKTDSSIVHDRPGVTRDRVFGTVAVDEGQEFLLIDTGGFETDEHGHQSLDARLIWQQTEQAIQSADALILLLDGKHGVHLHDHHLAEQLKQTGKPVIFAVNKVDGREQNLVLWDFYPISEALVPISAAHGYNTDILKERLVEAPAPVSRRITMASDGEACKIAIVGRPNAGKSSLVNRLLGEDRCLVSDVAGTTRDAIDAHFRYDGKPYVLIDTAGIRRRSKVKDGIEVASVARALGAISRADVVLYIIDALEGITDQDARVLNYAIDRLKPLLLVVNKWDLVPEKETLSSKRYQTRIHQILKEQSYLPVHFMSCQTKQRVHSVMKKVTQLFAEARRKVPTSEVNICLQRAVDMHAPHLMKHVGKRIKFFYSAQIGVKPPNFVIKCNVAREIQTAYKRYLEKAFRRDLGFPHVPLRMIFKGKADGDAG